MAGLNFHETARGTWFFDVQLPKLTKAIDRLAAAIEEANTKPNYTDYTLVFKYVKGKMVYFSGTDSIGEHQFTENEAAAVKFHDLDEAMKYHMQEGYGLLTKVNPVQDGNSQMTLQNSANDNTNAVIEAARKAASIYSTENVDVILNEMSGMLDVIYHSDAQSFLIQHSTAALDSIDRNVLIEALNGMGVGYCF